MTEKYGTKFSSDQMTGKIILNSNPVSLNGTRIMGPSYIGNSVSGSENSKIDSSAIYDNVQIGGDVVIIDSILMDGYFLLKQFWKQLFCEIVRLRRRDIIHDLRLYNIKACIDQI